MNKQLKPLEIYAQRQRRVWTVLPDVKQLRVGERNLYKDAEGKIYYFTREGDAIYITACYEVDTVAGSSESAVALTAETMFRRYAFLVG